MTTHERVDDAEAGERRRAPVQQVRPVSDSPEVNGPDGRDVVTDPWTAVQAEFVDDPRRAVEQADRLVSARLAELMAPLEEERAARQAGDGDLSTEDLRLSLQRYRSIFERLGAV